MAMRIKRVYNTNGELTTNNMGSAIALMVNCLNETEFRIDDAYDLYKIKAGKKSLPITRVTFGVYTTNFKYIQNTTVYEKLLVRLNAGKITLTQALKIAHEAYTPYQEYIEKMDMLHLMLSQFFPSDKRLPSNGELFYYSIAKLIQNFYIYRKGEKLWNLY